MRKAPYKKRGKRDHAGCGIGLFVFLVFVVVIIGVANLFVKKYFGSNISTQIKQSLYPIKYELYVEQYSDEYNLDKYLIFSVIKTESQFDVYAVSTANAKGLMQLTDETGKDCAKKLGIDDYTENKLFDPEINIRMGCYYLSTLIKKYGDVNTALAAYNGGLGNVDKWLRDSECVDENGKLINIPFKETRNYVIRVNNAIEKYKSIYENK